MEQTPLKAQKRMVLGRKVKTLRREGIIPAHVFGHKIKTEHIQVNPVTDQPLHIDFYQVNLSEKVKVDVPLEIVGEAPAAQKKIGLLLTPVSELEIEALPGDIPDKIEIDIT